LSLIDARAGGLPPQLDTDVCVIGAGAAGITAAVTLQRSGRDVCLVESGGFAPDPETQSLYDLESVGHPQRPDYMARARYFGGTCNLWAGRSMALSPLDFERRDWVSYSGWPIAHADVVGYYPPASEILGLPDLGTQSGPSLRENLSPHERGLFDGGPFAPAPSAWARKPKRFGAAYRQPLRRATNVRVLLNLSATRLVANVSGTAIDAVEAGTLDGARLRIRARQFVLACGGLENARLLLASRAVHAEGIGNRNGLVGRFFMDHPRAVFGRVHVSAGVTLPLLRGRPLRDGRLQVGIGLSPETQRRERLLNHYVTLEELTSGYAEASYQAVVQTMKVVLRRGHAGSRWDFARKRLADIPEMIYLLSPKELMPHALYRAYAALRDALPHRRGPRTFVAVYFCEQPPNPDSRVTLGDDNDRLGVPLLKLDWRIDDSVRQSVLRLQELLAQQLERTGIGRLENADAEPRFTDASHHMGTTRMSASPAQGVVDTECRVHGIANLYVAGSSVFPCAGHANPTLTIVALCLRLCERALGAPGH
jgi:choline dehydrogenase-like flavoprotein